jgi:hypothetical protein
MKRLEMEENKPAHNESAAVNAGRIGKESGWS